MSENVGFSRASSDISPRPRATSRERYPLSRRTLRLVPQAMARSRRPDKFAVERHFSRKVAGSPRVQSSLPSCNLRMHPTVECTVQTHSLIDVTRTRTTGGFVCHVFPIVHGHSFGARSQETVGSFGAFSLESGKDYLALPQFFPNHRRYLRSEDPSRVDKSPAEWLTR